MSSSTISLVDAIREDAAGNVVAAADMYEEVLKTGNGSEEAYINLAFLYWQCTEYGFNAGFHLSLEFIHRAAKRYEEVLQEAEERFPDNSEIRFWKLYFNFAGLGDPPFVKECKRLVSELDVH